LTREAASFDGKTWTTPKQGHGSSHGHFIKWHTFSNNEDSVTQDVKRIREHRWRRRTSLSTDIYHVAAGRPAEVPAAKEAERPGFKPSASLQPRGADPFCL
jgi:carbonic anhydrase